MTEPFGYRTTAMAAIQHMDLASKSVIVTGGYSGIGLETAKALRHAGADVTIACRDLDRARTIAASFEANALELDLSSLTSIRRFVENYRSTHSALHILVNNAAVMACPRMTTEDGFEMQFGTNHLGHYALSRLLLPELQNAGGARVICLSSTGHLLSPVVFDDIQFERRLYDPWLSYGQAKTANSLTAVAIQHRYQSAGIEAFPVHPGGIMTNLQRHMTEAEIRSRGWVDTKGNINERFKSVEEGASTSTWAATNPALHGQGGCYLEDCGFAKIHQTHPGAPSGVMTYAIDANLADQLWQTSEALIEAKIPDYFA